MEAVDSLVISNADKWHLRSVETISYLQEQLEPYESWVVQVSVLGDNREAFTFFFPIFVGLANELGARVLWAAIIVEWSNLLLKWTFKGDRPYWWIGETPLYTDETRPKLRQFPNTCESGPGTPSGHLMMNVAIFYVAARGVTALFIWKSKRLSKPLKYILSMLVYAVYVLWISAIFVSRLYIQAHFIHQCILGVTIGLLVGHFAWKSRSLVHLSKVWAIILANILILSSVLAYSVLLSQGMDPLWTVPLALKYCIQSHYVKIDTQAFYLIMRFSGAALGLGVGISSEQRLAAVRAPRHFIRSLLGIKGGILIGRMVSMIQQSCSSDVCTVGQLVVEMCRTESSSTVASHLIFLPSSLNRLTFINGLPLSASLLSTHPSTLSLFLHGQTISLYSA